MRRVIVTELSFEIPDGFEEHSIAMFGDAPDQKLSRFAIVVTRRPLEGEPIDRVVERELRASLKTVNGQVLGIERRRLHGFARVDVTMRTKPAGAQSFLYQRSVAVDWGGTGVMFTASSAMKDREACDRELDEMLQSTRFRRAR